MGPTKESEVGEELEFEYSQHPGCVGILLHKIAVVMFSCNVCNDQRNMGRNNYAQTFLDNFLLIFIIYPVCISMICSGKSDVGIA